MYLIFDTETTGLPKSWDAPVTDADNWPRCVQIAWQLHEELGNLIEHNNFLIKPDGFNIPYDRREYSRNFYRIITRAGNSFAGRIRIV